MSKVKVSTQRFHLNTVSSNHVTQIFRA